MPEEHDISPNAPDASAFADAAWAYCDFIDAAIERRPDPFYEPLQRLLMRLVERVEPLPEFAPNMPRRIEAAFEAAHPSQGWWCLDEVMRLLGEDDARLVEWGSFDHDQENRRWMLCSDLAEIYVDLQKGLAWWRYDAAMSRSMAVWEWRFGYRSHWGAHCFQALWSVHEMRCGLYLD